MFEKKVKNHSKIEKNYTSEQEFGDIEAAGIIHNVIYSVGCVSIAYIPENTTVIVSCQKTFHFFIRMCFYTT